MHLTRLEVRHLRNLISVSLSPADGLNVIVGLNGSGKTSLLEAIHLIALARSFRTIKTKNIVQHNENSLTLFAELANEAATHRIGLQRFRDNRIQLRLNGHNLTSRAELANLLPLLLITPESLSLLTGSPKERRQYVDWLMFHVEHSFQSVWISYQRTLKQRNAVLRSNNAAALKYWDQQLIKFGETIDSLRKQTLQRLLHSVQHYFSLLLPSITIEMEYKKGWPSDIDLATALKDSYDKDLKHRYTSVGPHRADIIFKSNGIPLIDHFSRGQLKLVLCSLKLGQMADLNNQTGKNAVVLLDDLPAELDSKHRELLLTLLLELNNQVFITATDRVDLNNKKSSDVKVFHVEHGEIKEVV